MRLRNFSSSVDHTENVLFIKMNKNNIITYEKQELKVYLFL